MALIQLDIHECAFGRPLLFPFLSLFSSSSVPDITEVDRKIKGMTMVNISLIKDPANLILAQRPQLSLTMILVDFKGLSILIKVADRLNVMIFRWQSKGSA